MKHSVCYRAAAVATLAIASGVQAEEFYSFDGVGFPTCYNVTTVHNATSVDDSMCPLPHPTRPLLPPTLFFWLSKGGKPNQSKLATHIPSTTVVSIVKAAAAANGTHIRASGKGHMWYDTMCADVPTEIIRTEFVNNISDFDLPTGAANGTVVVEAGVTFFQLADYLHARGANIGTGLVNWNISLGGSVAMGAHRSSLGSYAVVVGGVLEMDIIDGSGTVRTVVKDEADDEWLAASTSLGLLGIIARLKMQIYPETVLWANQTT